LSKIGVLFVALYVIDTQEEEYSCDHMPPVQNMLLPDKIKKIYYKQYI
jgi:hypothetical protein